MTRRLPLGPALAEAVGFLPRAWLGAWGSLLLLALAIAGLGQAHQAHASAALWIAVSGLAVVLAGLAAEGALYRIGVSRTFAEARKRGLGFAGLQLRAAELRIVAAAGLITGFLAVVALGLGVLILFVASLARVDLLSLGAAGSVERAWASRDTPTLVVIACVLGSVAILIQIAARTALYRAATVGRNRIVSLDALALSEGNLAVLIAGLVISFAPTFALLWMTPSILPLAGGSMLALHRIYSGFLALVQVPISIGFLSSAYKRLEYGAAGSPGGG